MIDLTDLSPGERVDELAEALDQEVSDLVIWIEQERPKDIALWEWLRDTIKLVRTTMKDYDPGPDPGADPDANMKLVKELLAAGGAVTLTPEQTAAWMQKRKAGVAEIDARWQASKEGETNA